MEGEGDADSFLSIQYEAEGIVDPLKYLCEMRQDRGGIIQTPVRPSIKFL